MPMYWLLRMKILIGSRYCAAVDISCMVISTEASPAMSITSDFGMRELHADRGRQAVAHGAEPAAEVIQRFGSSNLKNCAAHIWCWPTSVVM